MARAYGINRFYIALGSYAFVLHFNLTSSEAVAFLSQVQKNRNTASLFLL